MSDWADLVYRGKRWLHWLKTGVGRGLIAQMRYGNPQKKLKLIGVTGTDGKTTSSTLIYHLLKSAGKKVGLISTVGAYINGEELDTGLHTTTPDPATIYKLLKRMVQENIEYVVLEVTSQGLYQFRTWGMKFLYGAVTNLDIEHLEYHITQKNYWQAKMELLRKSKTVVLDGEMKELGFVKKNLRKNQRVLYYGLHEALPTGLAAVIKEKYKEEYNQKNARLAIVVAQDLGIEKEKIAAAIKNSSLPAGRLQFVENKRGLQIIVDFGHTPQAIATTAETVRKKYTPKGAKLISLYGVPGKRDPGKRPAMGRAGAEWSDYVIFTMDDARDENVWSIINQMKSDLEGYYGRVLSIPDRGKAIDFALNKLAKKGDTVVLFGKGHEKSLAIGKEEITWDDVKAAKKYVGRK